MAESSESKMQDVLGTLVWINLNLEKDKEWEEYIRLEHPTIEGSVIQTYLVHSGKQDSRTDPELFFRHQSNVHGIVVASTVLSEQENEKYVKMVGNVAECFLPDIIIVEDDFIDVNVKLTKRKLNALSCSSVHKESFFTALEEGLEILREAFNRSHRNKKDAKYFGASQGKVRVALERCGERPEGTSGEQFDLSASGSLQTPQQVVALERMPNDVRENHDPDKEWQATEEWVINNQRAELMQNSRPGIFRESSESLSSLYVDPSTTLVLDVLEQDLKATQMRAIKCSRVRGIITCMHLPKANPLRSKKRAKVVKSQSALILNIDYDAWTFFRSQSIVNSVVWVIPHDKLERLMKTGHEDIFSCGETRLVTNQTVDKRRIIVKPPLREKEDGEAERLVLVLLTDIHQMIFLYESFKATAKRLRNAPATKDSKKPHSLINNPDDVMMSNQLESSSKNISKTVVQICLAVLSVEYVSISKHNELDKLARNLNESVTH